MEWKRTLIVSDIMSQEVGKPYQLFMHHVSTKIPKHLILQFQVGIGRQQHSGHVKGCLVFFPEPILSIILNVNEITDHQIALLC